MTTLCVCCLLAALEAISGVAGEETGGALPITVFFSKEDPRWPQAEKVIDQTVKELPRLSVRKVSIDDAEGYNELSTIEQQRHISDTGDITLVIGAYTLIDKGERREIETYFPPMIRRILTPNAGKGRLSPDISKYAGEIFGKEAKIEPAQKTDDVLLYSVASGDKRVGWVADAFSLITCPTCNDTQFLAAVRVPELKIIDVRPVRELERLGLSLDAKETAAFVSQFKGLSPQSNAAKVDIISGATKTSVGYQAAINKILDELKRRTGP
ncbi:MAG TPA: FMN-binding protein [Planctomycetota bacterium]